MGGGGSGGGRSKSKPKITPPQEAIWRYYMSDILPMARGQDTVLTRMLEQGARDEGARQQGKALQGIMEMAGRTGMGAGEVASLQKGTNEQAIQQTLKNIAGAKKDTSLQALQMISGLPMISQESESKQKGSKGYLWGLYSG